MLVCSFHNKRGRANQSSGICAGRDAVKARSVMDVKLRVGQVAVRGLASNGRASAQGSQELRMDPSIFLRSNWPAA
jgi:hypothetical protein